MLLIIDKINYNLIEIEKSYKTNVSFKLTEKIIIILRMTITGETCKSAEGISQYKANTGDTLRQKDRSTT